MAIQPMALAVETPQIDAMGEFAKGASAGMQLEGLKREQAMQGIQNIAAVALGAMGGDIDGEVNPEYYKQGLELLSSKGVISAEEAQKLSGNPEYAKVAARASLSALEQIKLAQDEKSYQLALKKFEQDLNAPVGASSPLGKLAEDYRNGFIDKDAYDKAVAKQVNSSNGITITNPDGTVTQIGGTMPKLTEGQSKDVVYATRAAGSLPIIDEFGNSLTSLAEQGMENTPGGIGRYMQSEEFQKAKQAGDEFLAAILRKDTGAAITKDEQESYGNTYLPRPGDTPALLQQKKEARARALKALSLAIPAEAILAMERAGVDFTQIGGAPGMTTTPAPGADTSGDEDFTILGVE